MRGLLLWHKMKKQDLSLFFSATAPAQCCMKDKSNRASRRKRLLTRFLLIQQKRAEMMNLEEAIGEYEFSSWSKSLFASDGISHLPSVKYELTKQTENIVVPNCQNLD